MTSPDNKRLDLLEDALSYHFQERQLLERAVTHSSWRHEAKAAGVSDPEDNEPLRNYPR